MAVNKGVSVKVEGLKQFRKELAKVEGEGPGLFKEANWRVGEWVAQHAAQRAGGVSRQAAKAAGTLKSSRSGVSARVIGGSGIGFFFGAEFGSTRFKQFMPHLGQTGYFLFPTIRDNYEEIIDMYGDELMKVSRAAFPD